MSEANPAGPTPGSRPEATRLESVDELRRALAPSATVLENPVGGARLESPAERVATARTGTVLEKLAGPTATRLESADEIRKARAASVDSALFRPVRRPPMAMLVVLDDGARDGEVVRLRADATAIGRTEGDVVIPHDGMMSARHAEIVREPDADGWRWAIVDLNSRNGVFVRVPATPVRHRSEVLVGGTLLRFEDAALNLPGALPEGPATVPTKTQGWQALKPTDLKPSLVVVSPDGAEEAETRFFLDAKEHMLGRDPAGFVVADDLLLDARHARIVRDASGGWSIVDAGSRNGLWLRVERHVLEEGTEFQLGEQRFVFRTVDVRSH